MEEPELRPRLQSSARRSPSWPMQGFQNFLCVSCLTQLFRAILVSNPGAMAELFVPGFLFQDVFKLHLAVLMLAQAISILTQNPCIERLCFNLVIALCVGIMCVCRQLVQLLAAAPQTFELLWAGSKSNKPSLLLRHCKFFVSLLDVPVVGVMASHGAARPEPFSYTPGEHEELFSYIH